MTDTNASLHQDNRPWWTFPHLWLVLSGPALVVVASVITFVVAMKGMDPVVDENYYQQGLKLAKPVSAQDASLMPAMNARNHAATVPSGNESFKPADQ